ncbi:hypothetical protein GPA27_15475 [Aromatoleum toluolicum]|uniref:Uncharacterized protein n=1 Tax=Aromatoleum toluolicum TaxID=90060 RepID=A0ABX1NI13_9RHOO|nr:hypothetical protein [Aromatoleum toluolicum]NMF98783.1 hypothetical protein [Aromatoleum toluolicum]
MALETIPIQSIWRLFRWLPGFLLRQYFTQEKLAQLIYLDLRPRHNSATVDLGESASFSLYLLAINLSPFSVELDRAGFRCWIGGAPLDAAILKKQLISPGEIACLYISGTIPDGLANQIAKNLDNAAGLDGNIEFNCSVRPFSKTVGLLDGICPKIYNAHLRRNT